MATARESTPTRMMPSPLRLDYASQAGGTVNPARSTSPVCGELISRSRPTTRARTDAHSVKEMSDRWGGRCGSLQQRWTRAAPRVVDGVGQASTGLEQRTGTGPTCRTDPSRAHPVIEMHCVQIRHALSQVEVEQSERARNGSEAAGAHPGSRTAPW